MRYYYKGKFRKGVISISNPHSEESKYVPLPKFYTFESREERERILYANFLAVGAEVKRMISDIQRKGLAR
jgi:hypothetical protein